MDQTPKMEYFAKIGNGVQPSRQLFSLIIF